MKPITRMYVDAFLQNMKSVCFFTFLPVLIAKLGATPLEISLSNSLPPLFCALSLAFITRQLPLTNRIYYGAGLMRQLCFLSMAFSSLLPHPVFWMLFFWALNAMFVMITSVQQQELIRFVIPEYQLSKMFGTTKIIGIVVTIIGTYVMGHYLDANQSRFPLNYVGSMVVGALATFTGMNLIAKLAPKERKPIRLHLVMPLRQASPAVFGIALAVFGMNLLAPLWTIYHVNRLQLTNVQIGLFGIASGLIGTLCIPLIRKYTDKWGPPTTIVAMAVFMALSGLFYGYIANYIALLLIQVVRGVAQSLYDISQQTLAIVESKKHEDTLGFFSDYQLAQNLATGLAPLLCAAVLKWLQLDLAFVTLSVLGLFLSAGAIAIFRMPTTNAHQQAGATIKG